MKLIHMRKVFLSIAILLGALTVQAQTTTKPTPPPGQNTPVRITDPVKYNDYIVGEQDRIGTELLKLIDMFGALPEDKQVTINQLEVVLRTCESANANLDRLKPIEHEFGLRDAAKGLFTFYHNIIDTDYRVVIDELYADTPDIDKMQEILNNVTTAEATYDETFQTAQQSFAKYHNMELKENELQEEFDEAGEGN